MERHYGSIIVGIGAVMTCVSIGSMLSLAVFLLPMAEATGWSRAGISMAATLDFLSMGIATFLWGALADRFGTRIVVLLGSALLASGLVAASRAGTLFEFQILFGVLVGVAAGSFYAPMVAAATTWVTRHRSLAVALVSAGMGVAPLTIAPAARWLITAHGWRTAMLIIGLGAGLVLIPMALLVRPPRLGGARGHKGDAEPATSMTALQAFRTPQFAAIAFAHFFCCAAHSGPIFHMVSYAMVCGIAPMTAVSVYGLAGLSGLAGRIGFGLLADRVGAKPVLVAGLTVQALAIGTYLLVSELTEFYALSVVFGLAYGGVMPLYAILVRNFFGAQAMGATFGAVSMVASLGMALGPWTGGWVFDTFGGYAWMHIGSLGIGLGAVAVALSFPRPREPQALPPTPKLGHATP